MKFEDLKSFELNNEVLKDFDRLMGMHLDLVEELVFNEPNPVSKLFNIVSLCINVKKLVIKGNSSLNVNSVFSNICKPEKLEEIKFVNVDFPNAYITKKLVGLKIVKMRGLERGKVKEFLANIPNKDIIKKISIKDSVLEMTSNEIFKDFKNVREIILINVKNLNLTHCDALEDLNKLEVLKMSLLNIPVDQIKYVANNKASKQVDMHIMGLEKGKELDSFTINNKMNLLKINSKNVEHILMSGCLNYIDEICIMLNGKEDIIDIKDNLKGFRGIIKLIIKDISFLSEEDVKSIREVVNLKEISLLSQDEKEIVCTYSPEEYISIFEKIIDITKVGENIVLEAERFLRIYDFLISNFKIDDNYDRALGSLEDINYELESMLCLSDNFAVILNNCLLYSGLEARLDNGTLKKEKTKHLWNQVKIDGNWYNIDIAEDYKKMKGKKGLARTPKYCLISDKKFFETHLPLSKDHKYCIYDFDKKVLKIFFRTGRYDNKYIKSLFRIFFSKFKKNKVKMLPEGKENN